MPVARVLELQRAEAELEGQNGGFILRIVEPETRISEVELQSLGLADARPEEAIARLRDLVVNERSWVSAMRNCWSGWDV